MTTSNHLLTGTLIALAVKEPAVALPLAFLSHFALDLLPHFGENNPALSTRERLRYYRWMEIAGLVGIILLLATGIYGWNIVTLAAILAALPDLEWPIRIYGFEMRSKKAPLEITGRIHKKIQWCERRWGFIPEIIYFALGYYLLLKLT